MSEITREEVLEKRRGRYARAGREHKAKIIDELVELFGYHRKAAIRALRPKPLSSAPFVRGRPREYDPARLLPPLKAIWLAALQPCGVRLKAALKDWLPAYEEEHERLDADVREALLGASRATLDRLLVPARVAHRRRATTRPGTLLRQQIPIRTTWEEHEDQAGFLEMDTVALCGGSLDDRHLWMFDAVDIHTTWNEMRALPNRGEAATLEQILAVEAHLPFVLKGVDSDNGGEFINHHLARHFQGRQVGFTRSRPYRKNDNAHIEQKNYTQVRLWFGYGRYDSPEVVPLINTLCAGPLNQLLNYFLPTMKLEAKERVGSKVVRTYGETVTPLERVLSCAQVEPETRRRLREEKASLNPFALRREVDRQLREIERCRSGGQT